MKTLLWTAPESMALVESEKPVPSENEVLIAVEAVGICGSEIEGYLGHNSLRIPPLVMGHEFCGRIAELGSKVSHLQKGTKVLVNPLLSCGSCDRCRRGNENLCDRRQIIGIHRPGAYAEYVTVPASAVRTVPEDLSSFRAALAEPLACSLRATRRAMQYLAFGNVVVFGAGTIGLLSALVSKLLGAEQVIILDTNSARLHTALQVGIDAALNPLDASKDAQLQRLVRNKGVDIVIDAAGFQPTREKAVRMLNPGGVFMNIGLGIDETQLPLNHLIRSEIQLLGSFCYSQQDFSDAIQLLTSGRITEEGWSEIRGMSAGQQSFADLVAGKVAVGKIFLVPGM